MSRGTAWVVPSFQRTPKCLSPLQMNLISLHCLDRHPEYRLTPRWHLRQPCDTSRESHISLCQLDGTPDIAATAREESGRACLHSRRGLIPSRDYRGMQRSMSAVERKAPVTASAPYEDIAPTGEESRKAPHRSHGDWPFLRPQEWVPEVPVVNREESVATREKTGGFPLQVR